MVRTCQSAMSPLNSNWSLAGGLLKRSAISISTLAIVFLGMAVTARATNDRYVVAQFTNGTSTEAGGVHVTLDLTVYNDINNLQYPSHFIQWVQVTVPSAFTGSGAGGAFTASDFIPPSGWHVSSIAGSVITFMSATTDYTFSAGTSRTFLLKVNTPTATACPGTSYAFGVIANQSTNGGNGNTYKYRPTAPKPTVSITNCVTPTYLVMTSVSPSSIFTAGSSQTVILTATLTTLTHDSFGNPVAGTPISNEPLTFYEGSAAITTCSEGLTPSTNSSGVATCTYAPLGGPITPLSAGNYDESASFAGDSVPYPPYGSTNSSPKQLTVSASDTSLDVPDVSGPYGGTVTLTATLKNGGAQTGVPGQTIAFYLNGSNGNLVGYATTDDKGLATLSNVSIAGIAGGSYPQYIYASFTANGTYGAATNYARLTVTALGQAISFTGPGDQPLVNGSVGISATAFVLNTTTPSNLPVSFDSSTTASVCSVGNAALQPNGSTTATVTFQSLGLCTITASQTGNSSYGGATPVSQSFNIVTTSMICTLHDLTGLVYNGAEQSPTCTTNIAGVSCSVSGAPKINAGSYPVNAVPQAGYSCSASGTFIIGKALAQVIPSNMILTYTGSTLQPNVTTVPAGLALSYTGMDSLPQTNVGSYKVGWAIDDTNYYGSAQGTFQITAASQTITITSFKINATGGASSQPVTFSLSADSDPTACSVDTNGTVTILDITKWGNCHIVLNQAAGGNYSAAPARNTTLVHGTLAQGPATIDATQKYVVPEL